MKKQLDRIEAKLDEILRVETQLLKNTANVNGSKGLLQTIQAWCDSKNGVCLSERGELVYDGTQSIKPAQNIIINNLPSKPDWSTAPEWAQWWAVDLDGKAYWFDNKPYLADDGIVWVCSDYDDNYDFDGTVCDGDYPEWRNSLRQRPKPEQITITANLNADTDGYLAGKKSFISAYVDLLLARMANEERFRGDEEEPFFVNDVVTIELITGDKCFGIVSTTHNPCRIAVSHSISKQHGKWFRHPLLGIDANFVKIRPITQAEADEFRKAMEAVYG